MPIRRIHGHFHASFYEECWRENIDIIWPVNKADVDRFCLNQYAADNPPDNDEWGAQCLSVTHHGCHSNLICIRKWCRDNEHTAMLVHECQHAVINIMDRASVQISTHTDEAVAYLIESLFLRCIRLLNTKRKTRTCKSLTLTSSAT